MFKKGPNRAPKKISLSVSISIFKLLMVGMKIKEKMSIKNDLKYAKVDGLIFSLNFFVMVIVIAKSIADISVKNVAISVDLASL